MKTINAYWEKRNLGVDTVEIEIENDDDIEKVENVLDKIDAQYIVIKVPNGRQDLLFLLQAKGYTYVEDMVKMVSRLEKVELPRIVRRLYETVDVALMQVEDYDQLFTEIRKGMFATDRISIDPYFTKQQAAERYIGWIQDELKRNTAIYKYIYQNEIIGFFGLRELKDKVYTSFLGGIYREHQKGGIGSIVKVPEVVRKRGGKRLETQVSFNNIIQIRSLLMNGYIIESSSHTFIKHQ